MIWPSAGTVKLTVPKQMQPAGSEPRATGATLTEAVTVALKERLQRVQARHLGRSLADELDEIALHCAGLPDLDQRTRSSAMTSTGCPVDRVRAMVIDTSALLAILLDELSLQ